MRPDDEFAPGIVFTPEGQIIITRLTPAVQRVGELVIRLNELSGGSLPS
jgi:hypothetical protein